MSDIYSGVFAKAMAKVVGKKEGDEAEPLLHPLRSLLQVGRGLRVNQGWEGRAGLWD